MTQSARTAASRMTGLEGHGCSRLVRASVRPVRASSSISQQPGGRERRFSPFASELLGHALGGDGAVVGVMDADRPGDARDFVGQSDGGLVVIGAPLELEGPGAEAVGARSGV